MPYLRCPLCQARIRTQCWVSKVDAATADRYVGFARALLSLRCPGCDETDTLYVHGPEKDRGALFNMAMAGVEEADKHKLRIKWGDFARAECNAEEMLDSLLEALPLKVAADGTVPQELRVRLEEVLPGLIEDSERRLTLQLAWLRRHPKIVTRCCGEAMCFKCKVRGWHEGVTCEERQRREAGREAQLCPGCGVPVVKSEGCNHIVCVCGNEWTWDDGGGGDDDAAAQGTIVLDEEIDADYEPTDAEVREYAAWLGMDPEADSHLLWIAREGLKAPLPPGWRACQTADGEIFYFNFSTGESVWDHPCDTYYRQVFEEHRRRGNASGTIDDAAGMRRAFGMPTSGEDSARRSDLEFNPSFMVGSFEGDSDFRPTFMHDHFVEDDRPDTAQSENLPGLLQRERSDDEISFAELDSVK